MVWTVGEEAMDGGKRKRVCWNRCKGWIIAVLSWKDSRS